MSVFCSHSPEETCSFAALWVTHCQPGAVIGLAGPLGAGKTCFVQGLARGLGVPPSTVVNSPTFILLNIYPGRLPLYHFDWYRLTTQTELEGLGLEEYFDGQGITVVEWADKFPEALPMRPIWIEMQIIGKTERRIQIRNPKFETKYKNQAAKRKNV